VVSGHVQDRNVEAADQVLEVVEGQVATRQDDVGPIGAEPISIKGLVDLVGDREDAQWLAAIRA
jgi:hypothetical protein